MVYKNSSTRYDIIKLSNLIKNYVNNESSYSKETLSEMVLEGNDIVDALDTAKLDMEEDVEEYNALEEEYAKLEKKYKDLEEINNSVVGEKEILQERIKNIESLIKGKEGPFIEKIKGILKEY